MPGISFILVHCARKLGSIRHQHQLVVDIYNAVVAGLHPEAPASCLQINQQCQGTRERVEDERFFSINDNNTIVISIAP